ncbi:hypothetical protein [Ewingella americana]|uniref:Uncharacterized protein n=1 Tax=Ewingella americana TaxID=41202 RepID=A0A502G445_9GAMM|nr:hypothetical protein [Ewingella americana]TPG56747.1 hypothetical protein EAH77_21960 [Ewingella americana]
MTDLLTDTASRPPLRPHVILIVAGLDTGTGFHFVSHPTLSGADANLWFPLAEGQDLYAAVERVMVMNHAANNVVRMDVIQKGDGHTDYKIVYNPEIRVC